MAKRLKAMGVLKYRDLVDDNGWTGKFFYDLDVFNTLPRASKLVFVGSMGDIFHESIPFKIIHSIFKHITAHEQHTFIILTKRPSVMNDFFRATPMLTPPLNVWLGVTVESSDYLWRIDELRKCPAAVKVVSFEPLLSPVRLKGAGCRDCFYGGVNPFSGLPCPECIGIDGAFIGAETGPGKRKMQPEWAYSLQDQCRAAGVPSFFKKDSNGKVPPGFRREIIGFTCRDAKSCVCTL